MQIRGYKDTVEALEKLYELSREMLRRAHEFAADSGRGGALGNWQHMALQ
jgi:hypothetical protein